MKKNTRAYPGHPEVELALMRLWRATGNEKYKELAKHFVDVRGQAPNYFVEEKKNRRLERLGRHGGAEYRLHPEHPARA